MSVQQVLGQVALVQQVMGAAMKDGEHYGRIPGCGDKPTLLKPGAEKLCLTFRLAPKYEVDERALERGHREYRIMVSLESIPSGTFLGQGVGSCSTMEAKYRFRQGNAEPTDNPVPRAYWDLRGENPAKAQELIGGKGFTVKKVDGKGWMIAKGGEKVEHDNPADNYNTVLKMAKKRALVDAVLTATAASDIFTQDLEDITANMAAVTAPVAIEAEVVETPVPAPAKAAPPARPALPAPAVMTGEDAWNMVVHFGKNKGKRLRDLTDNQREYYFDKWPKETTPRSDDDKRLLAAVRHLAPLPIDEDADTGTDFRQVRIHFGKNRGLALHELTPQQVHWYETDWMPKKEVNGPTSTEDLALITALKAYRTWRAGESGGKSK